MPVAPLRFPPPHLGASASRNQTCQWDFDGTVRSCEGRDRKHSLEFNENSGNLGGGYRKNRKTSPSGPRPGLDLKMMDC